MIKAEDLKQTVGKERTLPKMPMRYCQTCGSHLINMLKITDIIYNKETGEQKIFYRCKQVCPNRRWYHTISLKYVTKCHEPQYWGILLGGTCWTPISFTVYD